MLGKNLLPILRLKPAGIGCATAGAIKFDARTRLHWSAMRFPFLVLSLIVVLLNASSPLAFAADSYGFDLQGQPVRQLAGPGTRVVVLIFGATDCAICNRYVPEIERLSRKFSGQGARLWWVFPNPNDTVAVIAQHVREFAITEPALADSRHITVHLAGATITPEAVVFRVEGSALHEIYRGRIDDRYLTFGQERPQANRHDLEEAITAALAGKPVATPGGPPVGCWIVDLHK